MSVKDIIDQQKARFQNLRNMNLIGERERAEAEALRLREERSTIETTNAALRMRDHERTALRDARSERFEHKFAWMNKLNPKSNDELNAMPRIHDGQHVSASRDVKVTNNNDFWGFGKAQGTHPLIKKPDPFKREFGEAGDHQFFEVRKK